MTGIEVSAATGHLAVRAGADMKAHRASARRHGTGLCAGERLIIVIDTTGRKTR